jgi:hypothetical protein
MLKLLKYTGEFNKKGFSVFPTPVLSGSGSPGMISACNIQAPHIYLLNY